MTIESHIADFRNQADCAALRQLMLEYSLDPMGGGCALAEQTLEKLPLALSQFPGAFTIIAYADKKPLGLANCFRGFSTFYCKPLINIHDLIVTREWRGKGIAELIMGRVEQVARERDCCKMTLEVLSINVAARSLYQRLDFAPYSLGRDDGGAQFWEKSLIET